MEFTKIWPIERALGVHWCIENDSFGFRISLKDVPLTRRSILATISSIYDPIGIAGPFVLKGKRVLQLITAEKKGWDEPVSGEHIRLWNSWKSSLVHLEALSVPRCYKPADFGDVKEISLHSFSDACDIGYGVGIYLRQVNQVGNICVSLVMGKSRVCPLKAITVPRLELTSATVSVKVTAMVKEELAVNKLTGIYWVDSKIVLGYIHNDRKRFRVFVANRTQTIRNYTDKSHWKYVDTHDNPADFASRGILPNEVEKVKMWLSGPSFLQKPQESWPIEENSFEIPESDSEVKSTVSVSHVNVCGTFPDILEMFELRISRWDKMKRVMSLMLKFINNCRGQKTADKLTADNMQVAENTLIKLVQTKYLQKELQFYQSKSLVNLLSNPSAKTHRSDLTKLDPFIDDQSILRVGGRLGKSSDISLSKYPAILPKKILITQWIVEYYHKKVQHCGRTTTISEMRNDGFWICGIGTLVRKVIFMCVWCRYLRGSVGCQKMAHLPDSRTISEGPFSYTGVDMFGPFLIKQRRSQVKRYVALFTCLSVRAVHLETTSSMSTDSFIQALRRFVARRGKVRSIISDNGTNFIGANRELKKAWEEMDHDKISDFLSKENCDWITWKTNPPHASHMGGSWERQIRTVRSILTAQLKDHSKTLDEESFRTFLCEAECIVNSMPLTVENIEDPSSEILTPSHILTMKSKVVLQPPGIFQKCGVYCRKRWRLVQSLANQFWIRWKREYLYILQTRNKWKTPTRNFKVNDVVLVKEDNTPRNMWPLARITNVFPDEHDNLVRIVEIKTASSKSSLKRPIHKLVLLVGSDE